VIGFLPSHRNKEIATMKFDTLAIRREGAVLFVEMLAPPLNLLGPELVRDLISLIQQAEGDKAVRVLVFKSADPDYFISHVDVARRKENGQALASGGTTSFALLFHRLSQSRLITIAQIEGRVRAGGSEFVLSLDMRFAAKEKAIFSQFESAFNAIPGAGAAQHLTRLMGRGRALEVLLSADDYDADLAERYGWINRALPAEMIGDFVKALAHRIATLPAAGLATIKNRVNAIALASAEVMQRDADLFFEGLRQPEGVSRMDAAFKHGFQTRDAEMDFPQLLRTLS
jgi:enoyl-CoA hydratase/carnithine racemase